MERGLILFLLCCLCSCFCNVVCAEYSQTDAEIVLLQEMGGIPTENGIQFNEHVCADEIVNALLADSYCVRETPLSFLISSVDDTRHGFLDKASRFLVMPQYEMIFDFFTTDPDSPIFVQQDGLWGYVSRKNGSVIIPFIFSGYCDLSEFMSGYALGCTKNIENGEISYSYILLQSDGTIIHFPEGIMPISHPLNDLVLITYCNRPSDSEKKDGIYQYYVGLGNVNGEILIPPTMCSYETDLESYFYPYPL